MDDIEVMLEEAYRISLQAVSDAKKDSEEASWELQKLTALHKQLMDRKHADNESGARFDDMTWKSKELKQKEEQGKKDRIVKCVLDGASLLIPTVVSCFWMMEGIQFEKTGSFTKKTEQWVSSHLRLFQFKK
jgi:hypothetical protein